MVGSGMGELLAGPEVIRKPALLAGFWPGVLLHEERHPGGLALVPQPPHPGRVDRPVAGAGFATDDDPVQVLPGRPAAVADVRAEWVGLAGALARLAVAV